MNVLFIDNNSQIFDNIYRSLMIKKITSFLHILKNEETIENDLTKLEDIIEKNDIKLIFININEIKDHLKHILEYFENRNLLNRLKIILFTNKNYDNELDKILKNNIFKHITFNNFKDLTTKIFTILENLDIYKNEKRKFIRFSLIDQNIEIGFKNPITSKIFTGKLINISFGGLSFKTYKVDNSFNLLKNKIINNFKIYFTEIPFLCDIKIIYINKNIICGQFIKIEQKEFEKLVSFIKNFILIK